MESFVNCNKNIMLIWKVLEINYNKTMQYNTPIAYLNGL